MDTTPLKPRVLCIDDQYGRNAVDREIFIEMLNDEGPLDAWCELSFCAGQVERTGEIINSIEMTLDAVGAPESGAAHWSLVLLDIQFDSGPLSSSGFPQGQAGDMNFGEALRRELLGVYPDLPIVSLSGRGQNELQAAELPYLSKKGLNAHTLKRSLLRFGKLCIEQRRSLLGMDDRTIARSEAVIGVYEKAFAHARGTTPCLLLGESGVGKELLARYLHSQSYRPGPFVPVNVAAIPRELVEAELFGIEKNTATGVSARLGRFEQAAEGTLFLDEIGDLPLDAQVSLLRVLQEGEVTRVGGREAKRFDIRLLTATSRNLELMVDAGAFRKDLLYRINTLALTLPPLRDRLGDIALLAETLLTRHQAEVRKEGISFSPEALDILSQESFPGNIRELEGLVRRVVAMVGNYEVVRPAMVAELMVPLPHAESVTTPFTPDATQRKAPTSKSPLGNRTQGFSFGDLLGVLDALVVDLDDPHLVGIKQKAEAALNRVLQDAAGAALERCRDPLTGEFNRQKAMKLLSGDAGIVGKGPARMINELLGRPLHTRVEKKDLEDLVARWRSRNT